jgi:hypothetical protein
LTTLNEPIFVDCARALALRTVQEGGETDVQRVAYAFRRCLARPPTRREQSTLLTLLQQESRRFGGGGLDPQQLIAANAADALPLPSSVSPAQLAAWTVVSRVLLNLDETITKE